VTGETRRNTATLVGWYIRVARPARVLLETDAEAVHAWEQSTGKRASTLRRAAFAAWRISPSEMQNLAGLRDASGRALTKWHVIELARLSRTARENVLEAMRVKIWTVFELRTEIRKRRGEPAA
jgi:hypothetical protein